MIYLYITVFVLILIILGLSYIIKKSIDKVAYMQELIDTYDENFEVIREATQRMLDHMRSVDHTGAFESDDEVGATFNELKELVKTFKETTDEYAPKEKS